MSEVLVSEIGCKASDKPEKLAFVDAWRWWLTCDHAFWSEAQKRKCVDVAFVRAVGQPYRVNRNIRVAKLDHPTQIFTKGKREGQAKQVRDPTDPHALAFSKMINELNYEENASLSQRGKALAEALAENHSAIAGTPASAASKVNWFLRPKGWTMFDRFVSIAVLGSHQSSVAGMAQFFDALDKRDFAKKLAEVRQAIASPFPEILAERVIDKYLFLMGLRYSQRKSFEEEEGADDESEGTNDRMSLVLLNGFVSSLPSPLVDQVRQQADKLGQTVCLSSLLHPDVAKA
ncbi:hypothetical protein ACLIMP_17460 [Novosphingobium aerophilum]|uniref:hypothetical protein n=1 Tax=Novosphingobium TaxID=165696 RepID=UPI001044476D|nr:MULTISPECIES: hypothetical protein [unclassified Novosphingobium]MPS68670.1 hypothetical protein [Novosphingobium sp.]TCM25107.1 hypothetical protein EDF59_14613 [Novosphingobium sp. ST904]WRT95958.1 hypothetical protein U9J33_20460 [Novosphingobium sp. RL4]